MVNTTTARFIFHAAGLSNKLPSLLQVLEYRNISLPAEIKLSLSKQGFLLFRSKSGHSPSEFDKAARAKALSDTITSCSTDDVILL
jgi:hypothetical protein